MNPVIPLIIVIPFPILVMLVTNTVQTISTLRTPIILTPSDPIKINLGEVEGFSHSLFDLSEGARVLSTCIVVYARANPFGHSDEGQFLCCVSFVGFFHLSPI